MKNKKIISILAIVLILVSGIAFISEVYAAGAFVDKVDAKASYNEKVADIGGTVVGFIQTIGIVVGVVMLIYIGIKYMLGSADEKAEYKKSMIPYLVGAVIVVAATSLVKIIYDAAEGI